MKTVLETLQEWVNEINNQENNSIDTERLTATITSLLPAEREQIETAYSKGERMQYTYMTENGATKPDASTYFNKTYTGK